MEHLITKNCKMSFANLIFVTIFTWVDLVIRREISPIIIINILQNGQINNSKNRTETI